MSVGCIRTREYRILWLVLLCPPVCVDFVLSRVHRSIDFIVLVVGGSVSEDLWLDNVMLSLPLLSFFLILGVKLCRNIQAMSWVVLIHVLVIDFMFGYLLVSS